MSASDLSQSIKHHAANLGFFRAGSAGAGGEIDYRLCDELLNAVRVGKRDG